MNKSNAVALLATAVVVYAASSMPFAASTVKVPLTDGCRFIKGDDPSAPDNLTQGEMSLILDAVMRNGFCQWNCPTFSWAAPDFDDSGWKSVRVPHDWGVEKSFDPALPYGDAYLDVTGVGWYRLAIDVPAEWRGKIVYFECDGAGRKTHLAKPIRRSGKADFYDVTLGYTETGLDAAALTNGFGLCVRLLDDDGEGLDCWMQLKRGVPSPFIRGKIQ